MKKSIIFLSLVVSFTTFILGQSESKKIKLTPYMGIMNSVSTEYDSLKNRECFNALRVGLFSRLNINSWMNFNFDPGGELNMSNIKESFPINSYSLEFGKERFVTKVGYFATPITCFRPHPLSIESQAEYNAQRQAPAGAYNLSSTYRGLSNLNLFITGGIAERGDYLGDSTEVSFVMGDKDSKLGVFIIDEHVGGALNLKVPEKNLTVWAYYKRSFLANYTEILLGKESNILFAIDWIYDSNKGSTSLTQEKKFFGELVFLYLFDIPYTSGNNFSGGVGFSFNREMFNIILFSKIL